MNTYTAIEIKALIETEPLLDGVLYIKYDDFLIFKESLHMEIEKD